MRTPEEHFAAIMKRAHPVPAEVFPPGAVVDASLVGRVLSEPVHAVLAVPPFSNSAMDGFLVHDVDVATTPVTLPVAGDVPAGSAPQEFPRGHAVRIMTGAPVPEDAAGRVHEGLVVVPVEDTNIPAGPAELPREVTITRVPARPHIRHRGENIARGDLIAKAGTKVDTGLVASLLSAGITTVRVHRPVLVGIVSSGDELVTGSQLEPGQLPDSNGPMLEALVKSAVPHAVTTHVHSGDSPEELRKAIEQLAYSHEVIITTGGVSAGVFDVVHATLTELTEDAWFGTVAQKPGAPQGFTDWEGLPIISLPGNPVAAFVSFHLYVSPYLSALSGLAPRTEVCSGRTIIARAGEDFPSARGGSTAFVPTRVEFGEETVATPFARGLGSHLVASLHGTDGLVRVAEPIKKGDQVRVVFY